MKLLINLFIFMFITSTAFAVPVSITNVSLSRERILLVERLVMKYVLHTETSKLGKFIWETNPYGRGYDLEGYSYLQKIRGMKGRRNRKPSHGDVYIYGDQMGETDFIGRRIWFDGKDEYTLAHEIAHYNGVYEEDRANEIARLVTYELERLNQK